MISSKTMDSERLEIWGEGGPPSKPIIINKDLKAKGKVFYSPESRELQQCKSEINIFYQEGKWDDYKKITNPYEYIFLSWNRRSSRSVASRQPLSRSYFKMVELWYHLNLSEEFKKFGTNIRTAHAAEGPGGFIEASQSLLKKDGLTLESATAITLRSDVKNVPGWRKASRFLELNPQVAVHYGQDGTGNILKEENQNAFVEEVRTKHPEGVHFFTADGGFDFSNDYNAQEDSVFSLLLAEAILGLRVLTRGGICIIKCFDTFEKPTQDLIWLMSMAFCNWGLVKPFTSRAGNAERYFIGKGFIGNIDDILEVLLAYQKNAVFTTPILSEDDHCDSWKETLSKILLLQERIEHIEISVIRQTLDLIQSSKPSTIRDFVRANVLRSIEWCKQHDEEISTCWLSDLERNVNKETEDLIHILHPNSIQHSWANRKPLPTAVTFEGFRSGISNEGQVNTNPFMRIKAKFPMVYHKGTSPSGLSQRGQSPRGAEDSLLES